MRGSFRPYLEAVCKRCACRIHAKEQAEGERFRFLVSLPTCTGKCF